MQFFISTEEQYCERWPHQFPVNFFYYKCPAPFLIENWYKPLALKRYCVFIV